MGLDQWAYARKGSPSQKTNEYEYFDDNGVKQTTTEVTISYQDETEISYWRKHSSLHGWMENLWREKGGEGEFNCVEVELTAADLDELEFAIEDNSLPFTEGFFFGLPKDHESKDYDLEFIRTAREQISMGYTIIYKSWW